MTISAPHDIAQILERVRTSLSGISVTEKKMFGGITLMLNGNMLCCASKKGLMLRVGKEAEAEALQLAFARPCEGTGRKMPGFIMIDHKGLEHGLPTAVKLALRYVSDLPPKEEKNKTTTRRPKIVSLLP